jgi:hypothetical protein
MKTTITLQRMNEVFNDGRSVGAISIGRGGKLHPAAIDPQTGFLMVYCTCPGTKSGAAKNKAGFRLNVEPTCGNR